MDQIKPENRLDALLKKKDQFLNDGETLIYVNKNEMIAHFNDGESLCEVNGKVNDKLNKFLDWLYTE